MLSHLARRPNLTLAKISLRIRLSDTSSHTLRFPSIIWRTQLTTFRSCGVQFLVSESESPFGEPSPLLIEEAVLPSGVVASAEAWGSKRQMGRGKRGRKEEERLWHCEGRACLDPNVLRKERNVRHHEPLRALVILHKKTHEVTCFLK